VLVLCSMFQQNLKAPGSHGPRQILNECNVTVQCLTRVGLTEQLLVVWQVQPFVRTVTARVEFVLRSLKMLEKLETFTARSLLVGLTGSHPASIWAIQNRLGVSTSWKLLLDAIASLSAKFQSRQTVQ
jgi:hypothetical protein